MLKYIVEFISDDPERDVKTVRPSRSSSRPARRPADSRLPALGVAVPSHSSRYTPYLLSCSSSLHPTLTAFSLFWQAIGMLYKRGRYALFFSVSVVLTSLSLTFFFLKAQPSRPLREAAWRRSGSRARWPLLDLSRAWELSLCLGLGRFRPQRFELELIFSPSLLTRRLPQDDPPSC